MKTLRILPCVVVTAAATSAGADDLPIANLAMLKATVPVIAADMQEPVSEPFAAGSWTMQAYGSATFGGDAGELYLAHVGFGYHIWDNFSFNAEMFGGGFNAEDKGGETGGDGGIVGVDLLARYHFYRGDGWSLYGDFGSGFSQSSISFPANGTQFNFTPQAGVGALIDLDDCMHLMLGVRWHHISNARMNGIKQNPGYDGAMIYAGVLLRF
jgi:hypothetical protein